LPVTSSGEISGESLNGTIGGGGGCTLTLSNSNSGIDILRLNK